MTYRKEDDQKKTVEGGQCSDSCGFLYQHPYLFNPQVLSVLALSLSWIYWLTFIFSGVALVFIHFIWCFRLKTLGTLVSAVFAGLASISSFGSAYWIFFEWCDNFCLNGLYRPYCLPFTFETDTPLTCLPGLYGSIAIVDGVLWLVVYALVLFSVKSRRQKEVWEPKNKLSDGSDLETFEAEVAEAESMTEQLILGYTKKWMRVPYLVAAQVLSVLALSLSWIYWLTFIFSAVALGLIQVIRCSRLGRLGMIASAVFAGLASISSFGSALSIFSTWNGRIPFSFEGATWRTGRPHLYGSIAIVDGVLWLVVSSLVLLSIKSRRQKEVWEPKNKLSDGSDLETFEAEVAEAESMTEQLIPCYTKKWMRVPYLVAAQVLSVLALSLSWIYWLTFIFSAVALGLIQVIRCSRLGRLGMIASAVFAGLASISSFGSALSIFSTWNGRVPFSFEGGLPGRPHLYGSIAIVDGVLWLVVFALVLLSIKSRRREVWELENTLSDVSDLATFEAEEVEAEVVNLQDDKSETMTKITDAELETSSAQGE